jgi:hypothetical protein
MLLQQWIVCLCKKASDPVDNYLLLQKFANIGFASELLCFFADYVSNRSQYVKLAGFQSQPYYTRSGFSQGYPGTYIPSF